MADFTNGRSSRPLETLGDDWWQRDFGHHRMARRDDHRRHLRQDGNDAERSDPPSRAPRTALAGATLGLALALAGCESSFGPRYQGEPQPIGPNDCGVFGESGSGETSGGYAEIVSGSVSGQGGGVVVRNAYVTAPDGSVQPCPLQVNATSPNSQVCVGDWCPPEPPEAPMSATPEQWGALLRQAVDVATEPREDD